MALSYETTRRITRGSFVTLKKRKKQIEEELKRIWELYDRYNKEDFLGQYGNRCEELNLEIREINKVLSTTGNK